MNVDVQAIAGRVPRAKNGDSFVKYTYGTAGFRGPAATLDSTLSRVGMLAALRSLTHDCAAVGVMITASHNQERDNGAKIVDKDGGMLANTWEGHATAIANAEESELFSTIQHICTQEGITLADVADKKPQVFIGRDTRPTSQHLSNLCAEGVAALGGQVQDFGVVTTPQLHYMVWLKNTRGEQPTLDAYYANITSAFRKALNLVASDSTSVPLSPLAVDCACGVGHGSAELFGRMLSDVLPLSMLNVPGEAPVNSACGAEHVQKTRTFPRGVSESDRGKRFCSLDGDADRIVYFCVDNDGALVLLDGDKISALVCDFLRVLLTQAGLVQLSMTVVQTAYANGASTHYLKHKLGCNQDCVSTGVKHLHHRAVQSDVGVYFEANGHGTVVFSPAATHAIRSKHQEQTPQCTTEEAKAAEVLFWLTHMINQAVGDAVSDMLLVELCLAWKGAAFGMEGWAALYQDLPSVMKKVVVKDREVVQTTDAERVCTSPAGLQARIDSLASAVALGRSFVRPSGTEDVVRVYAEAKTQQQADALVLEVQRAVFDLAEGQGDRP